MSKIRLYGATSGYIDLAAPAVADDATLTLPTGAAGFGKVLQVVSSAKTDTFTTSSATFTTVTGLTASITPVSTTSKIFIIAQLAIGGVETSPIGHYKVTRGGTDIYVGDAASSRIQAVFGGYNFVKNSSNVYGFSVVYLDSPATTSATTYQVECRAGSSGTCHVNRSAVDADNSNEVRGASSITVMEIGA